MGFAMTSAGSCTCRAGQRRGSQGREQAHSTGWQPDRNLKRSKKRMVLDFRHVNKAVLRHHSLVLRPDIQHSHIAKYLPSHAHTNKSFQITNYLNHVLWREEGKQSKKWMFFIYLFLAIKSTDKLRLLMNTEKPEGVASIFIVEITRHNKSISSGRDWK